MIEPEAIGPDIRAAAFLEAIADRYAIEREIGRGGNARVYLAQDLKHRRRVAIKVLPPDIANAVSKQRFLREIEFAARLTHPNILPLHDSGAAAGRLYFVMPFVEGRSLRDLLRERQHLPVDEAVAIATAVAGALDYAHATDIVHRDIKPENILIVAGHPVIADFGVARAMRAASEDGTTDDQLGVGTPGYMSPEQAISGNLTDGRADVYALGVVLFELITGELPFGHTAYRRTAELAFPRRAKHVANVPARLQPVLRRATAIEPDGRFARAADFASALRAARRSSRTGTWLGLSGGIAVAALAIAWARSGNGTAPVVLHPRRVVVAQFDDPGGTPELAYVGVMAADWVTEGLQRTGVVDVVPTPTALQTWRFAKGTKDPLRTLANETGAGIVISGSSYLVGDQVQIQVQVTDETSGTMLGAFGPITGALRRPTEAIEGVRTRVMGLLSTKLDSRIASSVELRVQPPTFEAYREFSEGLGDYVTNDFESAAARFGRAFERDTSFVTALLMASISRSNQGAYGVADSLLRILEPSRDQLAPVNRQWFDYRRSILLGRRRDALSTIRRIAAAAPGTKATYNLAVEALQNGSLREAIRALESLPTDHGAMRGWAPYWDVLTRTRHLVADHRREWNDAQRARERFPNRIYVLAASARALAALGRGEQLVQLVDDAERMPPDPGGATPADLALEAAMELRTHGDSTRAMMVLARGFRWLGSNIKTGVVDYPGRLARVRILYEMRRWRDAADSAAVLVAEQPTRPDFLGLAATAATRLGDDQRAQRFMNDLARLPRPYDIGVATFNRARVMAIRNRADSAVALLQQAAAEGHEYDLWVHRDQDFETLHAYGPFQDLIRPLPLSLSTGSPR